MTNRANLFIIHSWDDADAYHRMEGLLTAADSGLAHYSIPPWRALDGTSEQVAESIRNRIGFATAVVVLNTLGLHKRFWSSAEMQIAVEMNKRIIVLQPRGSFNQPIPQVLDGHVYRVAPWRSDVVGRAIRGEYPQDGRVFDLAEVADRREIVKILAGGIGVASLVVIASAAWAFQALQNELAASGVTLNWGTEKTAQVVGHAVVGAAAFGLGTALLTGDAKATLYAACAGGALGTAVGVYRSYEAALLGTTDLRVITVERV